MADRKRRRRRAGGRNRLLHGRPDGVYLANGILPLRAAISFYASSIAPDLDEFAPRQHGKLLLVWAGRDTSIPAAQRRLVEDTLASTGSEHVRVVFSDTFHGFFGHRRREYDPGASRQAWALVEDLLLHV